MVKIRLMRFGNKKNAFYRIVAIKSTAKRDGKAIEFLGTYAPLLDRDDEKRFSIKSDRYKYWISVGAQATKRVLKIVNILKLA